MVPSRPVSGVARFGVFEFDFSTGDLLKRGRRIRLGGQPAQVLAILLRRPGKMVTREEFQRALWQTDTHVNFEQSLNAAVKRLRRALGDSPEKPVYIETVARRGYRFVAPAGPAGEADPQPQEAALMVRSIAVLPFENATADDGAEYLVDGVTEALIHSLSRLPGLRVLARSTVFRYRGKTSEGPALGKRLGVDAVLMGRVSQRQDDLMIGTELVSSRSGWVIWGAQFSRKASDLLAIETELAAGISEKLRAELAGQSGRRRGARRSTHSAEAYHDYLKGRYHWNRMSADGLQRSVDYFQDAVRKDPTFALAHAGLADSYCMLGFFDLLPPAVAMPNAKQCAARALELDSELAEAFTSLANVCKVYDHDWTGAERCYRRALELNPNYVHAWRGYAAMLAALGRFAESAAAIERAHEMDPLSVVVNMEIAWNAFMSRRYDDAIAQAVRVSELEPEFPSAQYILALASDQKGRFEEARAAFERSIARSHAHASGLAGLAHVFARMGRREDALRLLERLNERAAEAYVAPYWHALVHAALGDVDAALAHLERGWEQKDVWMVWMGVEPRFDVLAAHTRFQQLRSNAGFAVTGYSPGL